MEDEELEELKSLFLEECLENIELLEQGLIRMGEGEDSLDTLNEVFRAAHSIKGGAATFGYMPMSELTHYMETLLDEMRAGKRGVAEYDVTLLLDSLDVVRAILEQSRESGASDHAERAGLQARLQASVANAPGTSAEVPLVDDAAAGSGGEIDASPTVPKHWQARFVPNADFYKRGNDPLLLLRELARRGRISSRIDAGSLPSLEPLSGTEPGPDTFDPTRNYLAWDIELRDVDDIDAARGLFEWIDTECSIEFRPAEEQGHSTAIQSPAAGAESSAAGPVEQGATVSLAPTTPAGISSVPATPATPDAAKRPNAGDTAAAKTKPVAEQSIRIATDKIDQLINLAGELVITQSMLNRVADNLDELDLNELRERLADLEHNTRELQESVMQVRMLPLQSAFTRLPRLVRDLSKKLNKVVNLEIEGGGTELDKTVLENMIDPLVHLVRNALDHGLETPERREAAGKPRAGSLKITARQESGSVIIRIIDDGAGIDARRIKQKAVEKGLIQESDELPDEQVYQLIFAPGFSTAETVSDVSGRGVGMDVVRRNIVDLNGRVTVGSVLGQGTTIEINLPLSLAILDGQLVSISKQVFVIPVLTIVETLEIAQTRRSSLAGTGDVFQFRGQYLPLIDVATEFGIKEQSNPSLIVVVETHGQCHGLLIDEVLGQQQVVIKPLEKNYKPVRGLAGATIMSDGSVSLILEPSALTHKPAVAVAA